MYEPESTPAGGVATMIHTIAFMALSMALACRPTTETTPPQSTQTVANIDSAEPASPQPHLDRKQHDPIGTPPEMCDVPRIAPIDANITVGSLDIRLIEVDGVCLVTFDLESTTSMVEGGEGPCAWVRWQAPMPKDAGRFDVLGSAGDPMAFGLAGRT